MKAITKMALIALVVLGATSCNSQKDWYCKCENDTFSVSDEFFLESLNKKDAKERCSAYDETYTGSTGIVSHRVCKLD